MILYCRVPITHILSSLEVEVMFKDSSVPCYICSQLCSIQWQMAYIVDCTVRHQGPKKLRGLDYLKDRNLVCFSPNMVEIYRALLPKIIDGTYFLSIELCLVYMIYFWAFQGSRVWCSSFHLWWNKSMEVNKARLGRYPCYQIVCIPKEFSTICYYHFNFPNTCSLKVFKIFYPVRKRGSNMSFVTMSDIFSSEK